MVFAAFQVKPGKGTLNLTVTTRGCSLVQPATFFWATDHLMSLVFLGFVEVQLVSFVFLLASVRFLWFGFIRDQMFALVPGVE